MKHLIIVISLIFLSLASSAQLAKQFSKQGTVKTAEWGSLAVHYAEGYLDMVQKELAKKFSKKLTDSIINNCEPGSYPVLWKSTPKEQVKMYKIGEFDNNYRGNFHGVQVILWVPYQENKKLWEGDYHLQPYDFFVFLPKEAVTLNP